MAAKKQTCDNCYNNIRPTVGRLVPTDECLEHNPDFGVDTSAYWEANGTGCPSWQPKTKFN